MSAKCCVCTDEFPGIDDLEAHISADHYNCLPFECEKCKFAKFPTEFAIKRHYEEDHGLMEYFIRYRVSREIYEKKQKIRECLERCIRHCDVSSSQHQIGLVSRSLITGDYPNATSSHSHYQPSRQQQLHESEFLTTPPTGNSKGRSSNNHSELFQQQHGPLLSSSATDLRHQHQSDFGIGAGNADNDSYETIGGPNLIGNLLEQIKPDVDGGPLSHFDQLYAAEVTSASEGPRGIEKFITTQAQSNNGGRPESPIAVAIPFSTANSQKQPPQQQQLSHPVVVGSSGASTGTGTTSGISTGGRNTPATTTTTVVVVGGSNTPSSITSGNQQQQQNGTSSSASSLVGGILAPRSEPRTIRPTELQCQVCKLFVVNRSTSLMYHVNVKHLKLAMYKCRSCGEEFMWNKSAAIKHAQRHGGDDALIENHSERLFPTLNRHRREYFNLPKRGLEDSPTPPPCHPPSGQQDGDNGQADDQLLMAPTPPMKKPKLEREDSNKLPANLLEVKGETNEDDEDGEVAVDDDGQQTEANEDKNVQTPNTILAQLVDMARNNSGAKQQQQQAEEREKTVVITTSTKGSTSSSAQGTSSSAAGHSHGQSSSMQHTTEHLKAHKSIQCGGCGDMVINQEWIMLNHVNTKHLHMPLYKCISCNKPFENYLRSYAVRHAKFYHAGDESLLLDQRDMYWGELREACTRLFGPISKGSLGGGAGGSAE